MNRMKGMSMPRSLSSVPSAARHPSPEAIVGTSPNWNNRQVRRIEELDAKANC
jgi:hypothetical protein